MNLFEKIYKQILLESTISVFDIEDAIDKHKRIIISYKTKGEDKNTGPRAIDIYAYGITKAGNPCIRAFQPFGDTTTTVPHWKLFRIDRIISWKDTNQQFERTSNTNNFNEVDDKTMADVYKIAKFDDGMEDGVYKTSTEKAMGRLKQQLDNPITLDDMKKKDSFGKLNKDVSQDEKTVNNKPNDNVDKTEVYKTPTERAMERLRQQLNNPQKINLDNIPKK